MHAKSDFAARRLYLIEFYVKNPRTGETGWEINFAWVFAPYAYHAANALKASQGQRFDCVIACDEQAEIVPLHGEFRVNTPDANLFIIEAAEDIRAERAELAAKAVV